MEDNSFLQIFKGILKIMKLTQTRVKFDAQDQTAICSFKQKIPSSLKQNSNANAILNSAVIVMKNGTLENHANQP